ncbi:hypothetical protein B7P43_G04709 [Cryptotermes secundus]|uniref:Lipocalin/cytosolic fatty-acid binding domain-containing protein n=1 Tax=Cryptotermes secundus TaxID=105785 RepID=A0A2J7RG07_9NEOP|nr:allergen Bla g 4 [Cryptotermes secundus]PNF39758.1 hypothetical protein B7P43_G04709 [Cryptotermes secundus]
MAGLLSITGKVLLIHVVCLIQSLTAEELICDPTKIVFKGFNVDQYLGVWHEIYHYPPKHQERYLCFIDDYKKSPSGDINITSTVYDKTEKKRVTLTGTVHVSLNILELIFDNHREWSTQYFLLGTDYTGYSIIAGCPDIESKKPNAYVLFRSQNPSESVKKAADETLKTYNLSLNDFHKEC